MKKIKGPVSDNLIVKRIKTILTENGYDKEVQTVICNLYSYIRDHNFWGSCHSISSVLYVALKELGLNPTLCIGVCYDKKASFFDHSWLLVDGKIIDLSIYMPLNQKINYVSGPIIFDIDMVTMKHYCFEYGVSYPYGFSFETLFVLNTSFSKYMDDFPITCNGLWDILREIFPKELEMSNKELFDKYFSTKRMIIEGD